MMGCLAQRRALSSRALQLPFAFACVATLLLGSTTNAGTVLQFAQVSASDIVTATDTAGTTTLSTAGNVDGGLMSIPVAVTNFDGAPTPPGFVLFETFFGVTSTAAATTSGGTISQTYSGTIEFSSLPGGAGADFLTATFSSAVLSGSGNSASLNATAPDLVFTSGVATFGPNTGMSIAFSGITPAPLSIAGDGSIASYTAQNSGTFSATAAIPEPGSLCLASFAVVVGALAYGRKKMKNQD